MIYIIHGTDTSSSRQKLSNILNDFPSKKYLDGKKTTVNEVSEILSSVELFSKKIAIIIEYVPFLKKDIIRLIVNHLNNKTADDISVIFWNNETLKSTFIKEFKNPLVFKFDLPKYYFTFLDELAPLNSKTVLRNFTFLKQEMNDELIFYSLIKRIRLLLALRSQAHFFDDVVKLAPWQKTKLSKQASRWEKNELIDFYKKLFYLEKNMKTSNLALALGRHIDILLATSLN